MLWEKRESKNFHTWFFFCFILSTNHSQFCVGLLIKYAAKRQNTKYNKQNSPMVKAEKTV